MSRLPHFEFDGFATASPANIANPGGQNSEISRISKGASREYAGPPTPWGHRLKYPSYDRSTYAELAELEAQVNAKGYVLLWAMYLTIPSPSIRPSQTAK